MVSSVIIGFTSLGFLLYVIMVAVSIFSFDCPFQTPLSLLIHSIVNEVRWKEHHTPVATNLTDLVGGGLTIGAAQLIDLQQRVFRSSLLLSWEQGYRLDARCITRMLGISTDMDTIRLAMDFIQEVIWYIGIENALLGWIYEELISCFDFTHSQTSTHVPELRKVQGLRAP